MLIETLDTARDLGRLKEILGVMVRHGFGDTVRRLGLADRLERAGQVLNWPHAAELARLEPRAGAAGAGRTGAHVRGLARSSRAGPTCLARSGLPSSRSCTATYPPCRLTHCARNCVKTWRRARGGVRMV
jgi:hypothetical protein